MNIFKILSSGDGKVYEPSVSSFLAFLLDPSEDHGISDQLLGSIISDFKKINSKSFSSLRSLNEKEIKVTTEVKVPVPNTKKTRDIDILIEIGIRDEKTFRWEPEYSICIENKITDKSIITNDNQLNEEYEGISYEYKNRKWSPELYFCYLTINESVKSTAEFKVLNCPNKLHLFWQGEKDSIQSKLINIMNKERDGIIDPISEDSLFLIKSFISFINTDFQSYKSEKIKLRKTFNYNGNDYSMGKLATAIINDYINNNTGTDLQTLQTVFDIKLSSNKKALITDSSLLKDYEKTRFELLPNSLNDGTVVAINKQWQIDDMPEFIEICENLGFIIQ